MNPNHIHTKRSGIMLAMPFEFSRLEGPSRKAWNSWPVIVQPKLNGVRCRALINNLGHAQLVSSTGAPITSMPHITFALRASGLRNIELDGELYQHGMPLQEINARVSRKSASTRHDDYESIEYHVFDVVNDRGQQARLDTLTDAFIGRTRTGESRAVISQVDYWPAYSLDEITKVLQQVVAQDYEGIIVRNANALYERKRSTSMMKFKPRYRDTYRIVGVLEEHDKHGAPKGALGALVVHGADGAEFSVGSGFTRLQRITYWQERSSLVGRRAEVKYHTLSKLGIPPASVFSCLVGDADEDKLKGEAG